MYTLIFTLLLAGTAFCQSSNTWSGITPLKSTRSDVEKILGQPEAWSVARHGGSYKTKEGTVSVEYSTGFCNADPRGGWNVPELTVVTVTISPIDQNQKFSALKLDMSKFGRHPDPGSLHLADYTNETDGVVITVDTSDNTVRRFGYFPSAKYDQLMCKNIKSFGVSRKSLERSRTFRRHRYQGKGWGHKGCKGWQKGWGQAFINCIFGHSAVRADTIQTDDEFYK